MREEPKPTVKLGPVAATLVRDINRSLVPAVSSIQFLLLAVLFAILSLDAVGWFLVMDKLLVIGLVIAAVLEDRRWRKADVRVTLLNLAHGTEAYARRALKQFWGVRDVAFELSAPGGLHVVVLLHWWCWLLLGLRHRAVRRSASGVLPQLVPAYARFEGLSVGVIRRTRGPGRRGRERGGHGS